MVAALEDAGVDIELHHHEVATAGQACGPVRHATVTRVVDARTRREALQRKVGAGLSEEEFQATPRMYTNINSTSPLKHDQPMMMTVPKKAKWAF